jgi:UDP-3-O-[3-hydroxymyristoyl] glucosamine N-acyltransferase
LALSNSYQFIEDIEVRETLGKPKFRISLAELALAMDARLIGDGTIQICRVVHPADARDEGDLAIAMEPNFKELLPSSKSVAALLTDEPSMHFPQRAFLIVERSRFAMSKLTEIFSEPPAIDPGIHRSAIIDETADIGKDVSIGPMTTVGPGAQIGSGTTIMGNVTVGASVVIGSECLIHAGVRLGDRIVLGDRVICQPNSVVGSDGFSFVTPDPGSVESAKASGRVEATNSQIVRINSLGTVIVGDDVEIGANVTIDRGTVSATRIGRSSKLDNQVQVGHNVIIGENCMICGQVGIAGSSVIGDRVVLAGQVGIADHLKIGSDTIATAQSGIARSLAPKSVVAGSPARDRAVVYKEVALLRRLKSIMAEFKQIRSRLQNLEKLND